ncbi:hypothetical protein N7493_007472 [Penicillium malachiteum]|uniref:Uncharacterized protein n=1 Tax=Penicillium malachiteum TaxID=1324776 RepID=A0AAD6HHQ0_9EURO|nr:hypothetical protein N7493_007472 [Penicillium malachiteum]
MAQVEWEILHIAQETCNTGIGPRFADYIHEHFRIVGFRLEERDANMKDLKSCQAALQRLHDANRYNFITQENRRRLSILRGTIHLG